MRLLPCLLLFAGCTSEYEVHPEPLNLDPGDVTDCGFTQVEGTDFHVYDCNPVFTTSGEGWAPNVRSAAFNVTHVVGHPFYQLWYSAGPDEDMTPAGGGEWALGYAVSAEGTEWQAYTDNPLLHAPEDSTAWNWSAMDQLHILWDADSSSYVGLYQGYNLTPRIDTWGLGVITSPDGVSWSQSPQNPVLDLATPVGNVESWCWPLGLGPGEVAGYAGYVAGSERQGGACAMYRISATDPDNWQPEPQVVLRPGQPGSWDDEGFISVAIAQLADTWYMFYVGFGDWEDFVGYRSTRNHFLGLATSSDGLSWTRQPDIVPINMTTEGHVTAVAAHRVGSRIHLWITDEYDGASGVGYFLFDPYGEGTE